SDERGEVALLNRAAEQMLGRTRREAVGMPLEGLLDGVGRTTELVDEGGLRRRLLHTAGGIIAAKYIPIVTNGAARGTVVACEDVTRIQELEQEIRRTMAKRGLIARRSFSDIIGESAEIKNAIRLAREYAAVDSTVLLYGESGTGKELFAQSLHNESPRRAGPFVAVNCATLPHDLLESTLFGYEDGAFTGAKKGGSKGLFELAHRGTLFLDEIAEMDLETQAKLLRVLQEREVMRLGGDSIIPVDVRIVASSNQRLIRLVQQGKYRADLYYRLSVLNIDIPALRQRKGDVALLARWLMAQVARRYGRSPAALSEAALRVLEQYRWPGNIRQLENVAQRIVLTAGARELSASEVESFLEELDDAEDSIALAEPSDGAPPDGSLEEIIRASVLQVLAAEDYNKTRAAKRLGITRATLNRRLEEHELK
ncbi:MAG: sigma 54-interacting transcriptional regulator, partial [Oscillospiraceae bacterium]